MKLMPALWISGLIAALAGCAPFVPVISLDDLSPVERAAAVNVRVFAVGQNPPRIVASMGQLTAYSCKHLLWSAPASRGDALEQLQVKAAQIHANAIINVTFDARGLDTWGTNCYQTVQASGTAVRMLE